MDPHFVMALLLAFIQSATEFLPVSSSAHLILSESFGFTNQGLFSDIALHAGTLVAILVYFHKDITQMFLGMLHEGLERRMVRNLIFATLPALIGGVIGIEVITRLRSPVIIAGTSILFGFLLWVADRATLIESDLRSMTIWDALCIGLAQLLALVPGVSRSGITITCCRALGFTRRDSTRFAMLLSVPVILAAAGYVIMETAYQGIWREVFTIDLVLGTLLSAMLGLLVIRFLMRWVQTSSFAIFALYRIALGFFILYYFLG